MAEEKHRVFLSGFLANAEVFIYSVLAVLIFVTALGSMASAGKLLWDGFAHWNIASQTLVVLDQLLLVLMLVEILHTEPFLIVALIASIRRILVITLETAALTKAGIWSTDGASIFRASMGELGLLGFLILALVISIVLLRRYAPSPKGAES
jgi:hypothetical protein